MILVDPQTPSAFQASPLYGGKGWRGVSALLVEVGGILLKG